MPGTLPPFGWKSHSEQSDAAAVEANAFSLTTVMLTGVTVSTSLLTNPPPEIIKRLESVNRAVLPTSMRTILEGLLDSAGRVKPDAKLYLTKVLLAFSPGIQLGMSPTLSLSPDDAKQRHFEMVALQLEAATHWDLHSMGHA